MRPRDSRFEVTICARDWRQTARDLFATSCTGFHLLYPADVPPELSLPVGETGTTLWPRTTSPDSEIMVSLGKTRDQVFTGDYREREQPWVLTFMSSYKLLRDMTTPSHSRRWPRLLRGRLCAQATARTPAGPRPQTANSRCVIKPTMGRCRPVSGVVSRGRLYSAKRGYTVRTKHTANNMLGDLF